MARFAIARAASKDGQCDSAARWENMRRSTLKRLLSSRTMASGNLILRPSEFMIAKWRLDRRRRRQQRWRIAARRRVVQPKCASHALGGVDALRRAKTCLHSPIGGESNRCRSAIPHSINSIRHNSRSMDARRRCRSILEKRENGVA